MSNNSIPIIKGLQGFSLMESLITMVLVSLMSLGMLYGLAKMVRQQGTISAQSTAINDVRGRLQQTGITGNCSTSGITSTETVNLTSSVTTALSRSCTYNAITMTVTGSNTVTKTVVHPSVAFSANDPRLSSARLLFTN